MDELVRRIRDARARGVAATVTVDDLPDTLEDAYALGMEQVADVAAWKIGGANPWSRKVFANGEVFFGPLTGVEVFIDTATFDLGGLNAPLAEPEIMLELGPDPAGEQPFARMGLGFEIPASVLPEDCKARLTGQIADRAGAGGLWISAIRSFEAAIVAAPFVSAFRHNEGEAVAGGSASIFGGPLGAASEFLNLARRYGIPVSPGQWIATGGLSPAVPVVPGDRVAVSALGHDVALQFR